MPRDIMLTEEDRIFASDLSPVAIPLKQRMTIITARQQSGLFITSGKTCPNVMSSHSGAFGMFWHRDVYILPVRKNTLTHRIVSETKCFAVSAPVKDMRNEIIACDRLSGYEVNKFEELHLHPARARKIPVYTVAECGLFLECRVIYEADTTDGQIDPVLRREMYGNGNFHTMYFAEIVDLYGSGSE